MDLVFFFFFFKKKKTPRVEIGFEKVMDFAFFNFICGHEKVMKMDDSEL